MAPPPSQAGRFKPRKPAKRIVPGVSTAAATADQVASGGTHGGTLTTAGGRQQQQSQQRPGRGGAGRQGRGGGASVPRGQVFFTGNAAVTQTAGRSRPGGAKSGGVSLSSDPSSSSAGGKNKLTTKMEGKHEASDEVIVGELDQAIGGGGAGGDTNVFNRGAMSGDYMDGQATNAMIDEDASPNMLFSIPDTYDSDSSQEEQQERRRMTSSERMMIQPSCLPFPDALLPVGIGPVPVRPSLYAQNSDARSPGLEALSPFVDTHINDVLGKEERGTWFLFQFPTRLPFENVAVPSEPISSDDIAVTMGGSQGMELSDVSVPTILPNTFDNSMGTRSGKLGKISVYKSGRTVLDMGGTKFLVSEGLPCGFAQHAVLIDVPNANYIPMGSVGKTVVVTPNVVDAFIE